MFDRFLHVRRAGGFTPELFDVFCASAELFSSHASKLLELLPRLSIHEGHDPGVYVFGPASLSPDRTIATLPLGGSVSHGARSMIEIGYAHLLWVHMPMDAVDGMDQGRTEGDDTQWWPLHQPPGFAHLDPDVRAHMLSKLSQLRR